MNQSESNPWSCLIVSSYSLGGITFPMTAWQFLGLGTVYILHFVVLIAPPLQTLSHFITTILVWLPKLWGGGHRYSHPIETKSWGGGELPRAPAYRHNDEHLNVSGCKMSDPSLSNVWPVCLCRWFIYIWPEFASHWKLLQHLYFHIIKWKIWLRKGGLSHYYFS